MSDNSAEYLGFAAGIKVKHLNIYDHLTPQLQTLFIEARKTKRAFTYKFCWAKNGFVYLCKSEESAVYKLADLSELNTTFSTSTRPVEGSVLLPIFSKLSTHEL